MVLPCEEHFKVLVRTKDVVLCQEVQESLYALNSLADLRRVILHELRAHHLLRNRRKNAGSVLHLDGLYEPLEIIIASVYLYRVVRIVLQFRNYSVYAVVADYSFIGPNGF